MANINITSDAWTEISITSGTVQNISATADIELSAEQTDNSGVVLKPSELYQWDNETIYARAVTESTGALRVVNFKKAAGGGDSYVLPVASASTLGGVKVGSNLSIDANGVLSATGGGGVNYSTEEQRIGTWIDGKPLYQITFNVITPSTDNDTNIIDMTLLNIDTLIDLIGTVKSTSASLNINFWYSNNDYISTWYDYTEFSIYMKPSKYTSKPCYITIKYTKTTD
jgi:hypothetical protein